MLKVAGIAAFGVLAVLTVGACGSADGPMTGIQSTTAATSTTLSATTTSIPETSTTTAVATTTTAATTTTTRGLAHEFGVFVAPADGQWFHELPIPWVFSIEPPDTGPPPDPVPGSVGWTREEAVVTVNGRPTASEPCFACMYQDGDLLMWRSIDGAGDPYDWDIGENTVVFEATFTDGVVVRQERVFIYEPSLAVFTGSVVDLDEVTPAVTFAAFTREMGEDDGVEYGPVTSVDTYLIRPDAAFILLDPDSGGQPPATVIGFDEFVELMEKSKTGECDYYSEDNRCFFAAGGDVTEYDFTIYLTEDGELQQLEQDWSP